VVNATKDAVPDSLVPAVRSLALLRADLVAELNKEVEVLRESDQFSHARRSAG
jgi:hypothetical protein